MAKPKLNKALEELNLISSQTPDAKQMNTFQVMLDYEEWLLVNGAYHRFIKVTGGRGNRLCMVGITWNGHPLISFTNGLTIAGALSDGLTAIVRNANTWKVDRYATKDEDELDE